MTALLEKIAVYHHAHVAWYRSATNGNLTCDVPQYPKWVEAIEAVVSHACNSQAEITVKAAFILSNKEVLEHVEDDPGVTQTLLGSFIGIELEEAA